MLRCLKIPVEKLVDKSVRSLRERITTLKWELDYVPNVSNLKRIIAEEVSRAFQVEFEDQSLKPQERALLRDRVAFFESDDWIYAIKVPKHGFFHSRVKAPGGLVRAAVSVRENVIQATYITGDFFVYPQTAIFKLESRLKHLPLLKREVLSVVGRTLRKLNVQMPGITAEDIARVIMKAASKIRFLDLGLTPEEADEVIEVLAKAERVLPKARYLLLPYCAKPVSCSYRRKEDCRKCNDCDFGTIYKIAEELGFKPITIVNYEHLQATLTKLKEIGEKAWMGSCCIQFYERHVEDFERIGLPGFIITTEGITCYDLGLEKQAYVGKYEGQSKLRVKLLLKLLRMAEGQRKSRYDWSLIRYTV
jgi:lipoate-protein ligase A